METLDVAIVGGGVSGIYTAWRLANATVEEKAEIRSRIGGEGLLRVGVFEATDRIGGRLLSASPSQMPDTVMELGGMRFRTSQQLVTALISNKLNLASSEQTVKGAANQAYLRGHRLPGTALAGPLADPPYKLTEEELAFLRHPDTGGPSELLQWAVAREFPEVADMKGEALLSFLKTAKVDDEWLYQTGFWNLLSRQLSHEGRQLALDTIGYDCLGANGNAVDMIMQICDFVPSATYRMLDDGFEAVVRRLADDFDITGESIRTSHVLESFDRIALPDRHGLRLTFEEGAPVNARVLVLALPQAALLALRKKGPVMDPRKADHVPELLSAVSPTALYKLFIIYDQPWWQDLGVGEGRALTDIPVRQCYYWATNPGAPSAIMAYNDQSSAGFWGGYETLLDRGQDGNMFEGQAEAAADEIELESSLRYRRLNWRARRAPRDMLREMHHQLMEMHGVTDAPAPINAAFMDWSDPPYRGAVHFWNPGFRSWDYSRRIIRPVGDVPAFIIGEAFSTDQTWVEGALQTSEVFLQEHLGIKPPDWL
ncbi:MAG: FAD-dependent oxidoreductase [Pseudomonadota bacterium]